MRQQNIKNAKSVFIVGIKGVAMSHIAVILKQMGKKVRGVDVGEEFITDSVLHNNNIKYDIGFEEKFLPEDADLVIYSASHGGSQNRLIKKAQKRFVTVMSQAEFLGELTAMFQYTLAVSGCHGKTTTSSLLANSLIHLNSKPSYMIGAPSFCKIQGGTYSEKKYFVIEADEYGVNPPYDKTPKFHYLHPTHIINTNIDFDHPDIYKDINDTKNAFCRFFSGKKLYLCNDDPSTREIIPNLKKGTYLLYGFTDGSHLQITKYLFHASGSRFTLFFKGKEIGEFEISLFGKKNILNTAGVILLLLDLGYDTSAIKKALLSYTGVKRRFEKIFEYNQTFLYDDYAHHPNEIQATIEAFRSKYKNRRLIIIFQPHTFSRTLTFRKDFARSLSCADKAFILPIFASAREDKIKFNIRSKKIEEMIKGKRLVTCSSSTNLLIRLSKYLKSNDVVCTMGAGDVYKLKDDIIKMIKTLK